MYEVPDDKESNVKNSEESNSTSAWYEISGNGRIENILSRNNSIITKT